MSYQHKDNTGSLFKNDRREKDTHPHAKGSAIIDGVEYFVSAWTNDGKNGKYQSLRFTRKDEVQEQGMQQARQAAADEKDFFDDDIPFSNYEYRTFA